MLDFIVVRVVRAATVHHSESSKTVLDFQENSLKRNCYSKNRGTAILTATTYTEDKSSDPDATITVVTSTTCDIELPKAWPMP